jgi:hypothetical protein
VVEGESSSRAQALLEQNRKQAVRELTKVLTARYVREAERVGADRVRALEPGKREAYTRARAAVFEEFKRYAAQRGPLVAELTSIVGFPDPNPLSLPPTTPVPKYAQERLDRAAQLRKDIASLDASYEQRVREILDQVSKQYTIDLQTALTQLEEDRLAALGKAEQEAITEASRTYRSLAPLVMGTTRINLPGEPAQSVTLPPVPQPMSAPAVKEKALSIEQRRAILKAQLDIWLALHGYELVGTPALAPDLTADFMKWRQERRL